jgi:hypothetical protein
MPTQAELESRLESLKADLVLAKRVTDGDKTVERRDVPEIERAIGILTAELDASNGNLRRKIHFTDSPRQKGWR